MGLKPDTDELTKLKGRGYRSRRVINQNMIKGRGIGLYLIHQICEAYGIDIKYKTNNKDLHSKDGYVYVPFIIELNFDNMIEVEPKSE